MFDNLNLKKKNKNMFGYTFHVFYSLKTKNIVNFYIKCKHSLKIYPQMVFINNLRY